MQFSENSLGDAKMLEFPESLIYISIEFFTDFEKHLMIREG